MHQYLDNGSGKQNICEANSSHRLQVVTAWLIANKFQGFLGEFAWTTDSSCTHEGPPMLDYVSLNSNVWIGWTWWCSGLHFYDPHYFFLLDPLSFAPPIIDRPQMSILLAHL